MLGFFLRFSNLLLGKFNESFKDQLRKGLVCATMTTDAVTYFYRSNIGVLGDVLVLIEPVLCGLPFLEIDA